MNIHMVCPMKKAGVMSTTSVGSHNMRYQFTRIDSGQIDNVRAMISMSRYLRDHWSGIGTAHYGLIAHNVLHRIADVILEEFKGFLLAATRI